MATNSEDFTLTEKQWKARIKPPATFNSDEECGIKFFAYVDSQWLKDSVNPKNWRQHPNRQRQAYNALVEKTDLADTIKYNRITGRLFDGHMRLSEAIKAKEYIFVQVGDWSEEQENLLLANFDPIGSLAKADTEALRNLTTKNRETLDKLKTGSQSKLKLSQLQNDLESQADDLDAGKLPSIALKQSRKRARPEKPILPSQESPGEEEEEDMNELPKVGYEPPEGRSEVRSEVLEDDPLFPSSTTWGIPDLLPELLATPDMAPTETFDRKSKDSWGPTAYFDYSTRPWGSVEREGGVLGFYCEDWRYNGASDDALDGYKSAGAFADELLDYDFTAIVSPDFSTYHRWPLASQLFNVYRSRWCARYWQELGIHIIPSIQWVGCANDRALGNEMFAELVLETLPTETSIVAVQCRKARAFQKNMKLWCSHINLLVDAMPNLEKIVIYGGLENQKYIHGTVPSGPQYIYLPSFTRARMKK